ncbi:hypothetical protein LSAT2_028074 [Lamellibrachia satsuma]|nr:hypothetical protein LSAT2_028074 [Lamellibrachia satsuma]
MKLLWNKRATISTSHWRPPSEVRRCPYPDRPTPLSSIQAMPDNSQIVTELKTLGYGDRHMALLLTLPNLYWSTELSLRRPRGDLTNLPPMAMRTHNSQDQLKGHTLSHLQ